MKLHYPETFWRSAQEETWERIWKSWAPCKCKFFVWPVAHDRCRIADRLAKRGLSHPERCPHCDQEKETISPLLLSCIFTRVLV